MMQKPLRLPLSPRVQIPALVRVVQVPVNMNMRKCRSVSKLTTSSIQPQSKTISMWVLESVPVLIAAMRLRHISADAATSPVALQATRTCLNFVLIKDEALLRHLLRTTTSSSRRTISLRSLTLYSTTLHPRLLCRMQVQVPV